MAKDLKPVGTEFFGTAPSRSSIDISLAQPPEAVFGAIAEDPAGWGAWFPGFGRDGCYLGDGPPGVGSQRRVTVGPATMLETVIAWEAPRRWAFRIDRASMPGVRAFAEDYLISPDGDGSRLTWTLATDLVGPLRALGPLMARASAPLMRKAMANLDRELSRRRG